MASNATTLEIPSTTISSSVLFTWTLLLVIISGVTYYSALPKPLPGIPYNDQSARRLMGDIPEFVKLVKAGKRPREFWANLCSFKNSAITQYFPGPFAKPIVVLSDFREVQDLFVRRSETVDRGVFGKQMWSGVGDHHFVAVDSKDQIYHASKLLSKDLMLPSYLQNVSAPIAHENVSRLIELWKLKSQISGGRPFKSIGDLLALTADTIFETAMGISGMDKNIAQYRQKIEKFGREQPPASSKEDEEFIFPEYQCEGLLQTIEVLAQVAGNFPTAPILPLHWPLNNLRPVVRKARAERHRIIQKYIDQAMERWNVEGPPDKPRWAVDLIIKRERAEAAKAGRKPDYSCLLFHDALYGYCLGGQDTTHSALSFLVKHFGMYPTVQKVLRDHLLQAHQSARAEGRSPSSDEICKVRIPYLDAFVEEVLRLNTTASAVIKETMTDITLLGHRVPKGHQLLIPLWGACIDTPAFPVSESDRSQTCQENAATTRGDWTFSPFPANEFHPERWLRQDVDTGEVIFDAKSGPQMTFSLGPRECWGKRLAYMTLRLITTMLVWNLEFESLPDGMDSKEVVDVLNAKPKVSLIKVKPIQN